MGIHGDYGKSFESKNNIYGNSISKGKNVEHKANAKSKETIDVTGAKYRGEMTDLNKTPESVAGELFAVMGFGWTPSPLTKDNANPLANIAGLDVRRYVGPEAEARIAEEMNRFTEFFGKGGIDDFDFVV